VQDDYRRGSYDRGLPLEVAKHAMVRDGNVVRNSLWAKVESEVTNIDIGKDEFNELFKADLKGESSLKKAVGSNKKKGAAVRVFSFKK
jgi:hypothetical protein